MNKTPPELDISENDRIDKRKRVKIKVLDLE